MRAKHARVHDRREAKRARRRRREARRTSRERLSRTEAWEQQKADGVGRFDAFFAAVRAHNRARADASVVRREAAYKRRYGDVPAPKRETVRQVRKPQGPGRKGIRRALRKAMPVKTG